MKKIKNLTIKQTFDLAVENHQKNNLKVAENLYSEIIKIEPKHANALNNLGAIFGQFGDHQKTISCLEKVIKINPNHTQAHNNLGNAFNALVEHQKAISCYEKAIKIDPNYVDAYYNLGNLFKLLKEYQKAINCYEKAIEIEPTSIDAHNNLGIVFNEFGKYQKAISCYKKAIALKPDNRTALLNRGQILFDKGEFELSLKDFDACNNTDSRSRALISLYALGRIEEIYQRIETHSELDDENIRVAAFSSFIADKEKKDTAHNFCRKPMDFINFSNLSSHLENSNSFITELIEELHNTKTMWEPLGKTTIKGSQSISNLFDNPHKKISNLQSIIIDELDLYHLKFKNESCSYIKKWPSKKKIYGWHVVLKKQGYQNPHIHPSGWLSGVIYLKVVPTLGSNEGAIEFGLNGEQYSDVNSPKKTYEPKVGDIVLFPSSLHHRTIPFTTDTDRIIVSFDLKPMVAE